MDASSHRSRLLLRTASALLLYTSLPAAIAHSGSEGISRTSLLQTGQTKCFSQSGARIDCTGSGQDGEFQAGFPAELIDNGDGTITDLVTGLMWEKMSARTIDDVSIHDAEYASDGVSKLAQ